MNKSAHIVFTQVIGLGSRPFPSTEGIRSCWHDFFNNKNCLTEECVRIKHKYNGYGEVRRSKPFVRDIGTVYFDPSIICLQNHNNWPLNELTARDLVDNLDYMRGLDERPFGFDSKLEDQRMNCSYFKFTKPLYLKSKTEGDSRAEGKIFFHIYPSGYVIIRLTLALSWKEDLRLNQLYRLLRETQPWRRDSSWIWSSRLGNMTLSELLNRVKENLQKSIYNDTTIPLRQSKWISAIKIEVNEDKKEVANKLLFAWDNYEIMKMLETSVNWKFLLSSKRGLICVLKPGYKRRGASRFFSKVLALAEFVAYKKAVYEDYEEFLRNQIFQLRDFRLSIKRKLTKEDLLRFSVYDHKIPQFLEALDSHIRSLNPFYRRIYSMISKGSGFDKSRLKVSKLVKQWEKEVEQWTPPLQALWKRVISPIHSILSSKG